VWRASEKKKSRAIGRKPEGALVIKSRKGLPPCRGHTTGKGGRENLEVPREKGKKTTKEVKEERLGKRKGGKGKEQFLGMAKSWKGINHSNRGFYYLVCRRGEWGFWKEKRNKRRRPEKEEDGNQGWYTSLGGLDRFKKVFANVPMGRKEKARKPSWRKLLSSE